MGQRGIIGFSPGVDERFVYLDTNLLHTAEVCEYLGLQTNIC